MGGLGGLLGGLDLGQLEGLLGNVKDVATQVPQMAQQALSGTRTWYKGLSPTQKAIGIGLVTLGAGLVVRQVMRNDAASGNAANAKGSQKNKNRTNNQ